ncbi:ABC transporter permease [Tsukamurella tyrosinosolvens]|uniref:ABC transporter permease n=1 Tax=Tsukamurella tyrosinosolvens TaxID=57704 RepID=UPI002DD43594|nr:ABC transporter permease [Tsukamurella tyrosinosolvens]MEC4613044.1 ABC transporter permease [Tsukamurella tyrosinosolvens]
MRTVLQNTKARIGVVILVLFAIMSFIGPTVLSALGRTADQVDYSALGAPPSMEHELGTTQTGGDVLNQLVFGARTSFVTGLLVALFVVVLSTIVGLAGGYAGGRVDSAVSSLTNIALTISGFPLLVVIATYIPNVSVLGTAVAIGVVSWPGPARAIRAQTLSLRSREYVIAMKMVGEKPFRIMRSEILPHLVPILSSTAIGAVGAGIVSQAGLALLGLGGGQVTWGTMIAEGQQGGAFTQNQWWWFLPPGLAIVLIVMSLVLINFGIDEYTNPRLQGARRARRRRRVTPVGGGSSATPSPSHSDRSGNDAQRA